MITLAKKQMRGVLSLISIQSTPLTVGALLFGYGTVEGGILTRDVLPLIMAGALSHWAFYAMNDILDIEYDREQNRGEKPLVSGIIGVSTALTLTIILIFYSLSIAINTFNTISFVLFLIAFLCGGAYNYTSKTSPYSAIFLGEWGAVIVLSGASFAGAINAYTILLSLFLGAHMIWMTVEGDLKDIQQDEASIPSSLHCDVNERDGASYLFTTIPMNVIIFSLITAEALLLLLIPTIEMFRSGAVFVLFLTALAIVLLVQSSDRVMSQKPFERGQMKRDIALHEIVTVLGIAVASLSFMPLLSVLVLGFVVVVWGTLTQTLLYGHPLKFP